MNKAIRPLRVGFILTNNFTLTALSNFVDVLRLAADDGDNSRPIRCQWHIMSDSDEPIKSSSGLLIYPTSRLINPAELDYVVVVGGLLHRGPQIDERTKKYLLAAADTNVDLIGVCTGSFVLWRLGLLGQKKCCISWYHYRDFLEEFGETLPVADQLYVIDGKRITCSGGIGVAYLAAHIVELRMGLSSAQKALHIMQIDRMKPGSSAQSAPPNSPEKIAAFHGHFSSWSKICPPRCRSPSWPPRFTSAHGSWSACSRRKPANRPKRLTFACA
jgi:transcriptional regulator GlxA family with amidase domain